jgi:hypothetical protein
MSDTLDVREEGFYWVVLGHNPPEIAYWERSEWWPCGNDQPWQADAVTVVSGKLVFRPRGRVSAGPFGSRTKRLVRNGSSGMNTAAAHQHIQLFGSTRVRS